MSSIASLEVIEWQDLAIESSVLQNVERVCKQGLLVVIATVKGFENPRTILIDSSPSSCFDRRLALIGSQLYAEAHQVQGSDTITIRLATGTHFTVPKVPVDLGVQFMDFHSAE